MIKPLFFRQVSWYKYESDRTGNLTAGLLLLLRVNLSQSIFLLKPSYTSMDGEAVWEIQFIILILVPTVVRTHWYIVY